MHLRKDYYKILGVHPNAENFRIHAAYRSLALRYHPDRFCGANEEAARRMREINEAYAVLSNSERRRRYDEASIVRAAPASWSSQPVWAFTLTFIVAIAIAIYLQLMR